MKLIKHEKIPKGLKSEEGGLEILPDLWVARLPSGKKIWLSIRSLR